MEENLICFQDERIWRTVMTRNIFIRNLFVILCPKKTIMQLQTGDAARSPFISAQMIIWAWGQLGVYVKFQKKRRIKILKTRMLFRCAREPSWPTMQTMIGDFLSHLLSMASFGDSAVMKSIHIEQSGTMARREKINYIFFSLGITKIRTYFAFRNVRTIEKQENRARVKCSTFHQVVSRHVLIDQSNLDFAASDSMFAHWLLFDNQFHQAAMSLAEFVWSVINSHSVLRATHTIHRCLACQSDSPVRKSCRIKSGSGCSERCGLDVWGWHAVEIRS